MRWLFAFIVVIHGLIHLMGPAKAFGWAELPDLTQPVSRWMGVVWALAGVLTVAAAVAFFAWPRGWWILGAAAVVLSQAVILSAWTDAKFGTLANVILLLGVAFGYFTQGPTSFRAEYERGVHEGLARAAETRILAEADLAPLPDPVRRYLRATGWVGQPRVANYRIRFRGRIRSGPDARWMPFEADQQSFADRPTRLFWICATMMGVFIDGLHRLADGHATMRIKPLGVFTVVDVAGPEMDQAESVTLFNDMCIMAPATLIDPAVTWEPVDARTAKARFTHAGHTIAATLFFDDEGLLRNFVSDDRFALTDGKTLHAWRFSTPIQEYRGYGVFRLASRGEARWHPPTGEYVYGEFEMLDIAYNVRQP
jgi:hypothetical protein